MLECYFPPDTYYVIMHSMMFKPVAILLSLASYSAAVHGISCVFQVPSGSCKSFLKHSRVCRVWSLCVSSVVWSTNKIAMDRENQRGQRGMGEDRFLQTEEMAFAQENVIKPIDSHYSGWDRERGETYLDRCWWSLLMMVFSSAYFLSDHRWSNTGRGCGGASVCTHKRGGEHSESQLFPQAKGDEEVAEMERDRSEIMGERGGKRKRFDTMFPFPLYTRRTKRISAANVSLTLYDSGSQPFFGLRPHFDITNYWDFFFSVPWPQPSIKMLQHRYFYMLLLIRISIYIH